jgi:hypothetical protein
MHGAVGSLHSGMSEMQDNIILPGYSGTAPALLHQDH